MFECPAVYEPLAASTVFWCTFDDIRIIGVLSRVCRQWRMVQRNELAWFALAMAIRRASKACLKEVFALTHVDLMHAPYILHQTFNGHPSHLVGIKYAIATALKKHRSLHAMLRIRRKRVSDRRQKKLLSSPLTWHRPFHVNRVGFPAKLVPFGKKTVALKLQIKINNAIEKQQRWRFRRPNLAPLTEEEYTDIAYMERRKWTGVF
eukprot:2408928-Rhodomonas_salina.2